MENRIKEAQLKLFGDRLSAHAFRVRQLRLWLATFANVLIEALRRLALGRSELARATAQTIRLKPLKISAVMTASVLRVRLTLSESYPHHAEFIAACRTLSVAARGKSPPRTRQPPPSIAVPLACRAVHIVCRNQTPRQSAPRDST